MRHSCRDVCCCKSQIDVHIRDETYLVTHALVQFQLGK